MENPFLIGILIVLIMTGAISLWQIGANRNHLFSALKEVSFIYFFSNLPVIILITVQHFSTNKSPLDLLIQLMNDGDVFVYTAALIAPVFWLLVAYAKDNYRTTNGFFLIIAVLVIIFSSISFMNTTIVTDIPTSTLNESYLALYLYSIVLWICSVVYKRFLDGFDKEPSKNPVLDDLEARK